MTRVYADMVADLFHYGHVEFLRRARQLGDALVVGIHSDATVTSYKRTPTMTMDERLAVVAACRYVDEVIPDAPLVVSADWISRHRIDLVVHGDDASDDQLMLMYRVPHEQGILRTLAYTPGISSTDIVRRIVEGCRSNGRSRP
jgi:cytidyltransferase-like protein